MKILGLPKATSSASAGAFDAQLIQAEVEGVLRLYQADVIREVYTRGNARGVVFMLEGASLEEVQESLKDLPAVQRGILEIELIPLAPFQGFLRSLQEEVGALQTHPG